LAASLAALLACYLAFDNATPCAAADGPNISLVHVIDDVQPKIVKIYGAGGLQGLEHYQSGFVISPDGHVLTVWSYVLDSEVITVVLHDGRKFEAKLVGIDPRLEIAVLKVEAMNLPAFSLESAGEVSTGSRVLAFSNLYGVATGDEPASVLRGVVSSRGKLSARRGTFETRYQGDAYVLDAMTNNPGAAGGALTDRRGKLVGILGKELRNSQNNIWLNFALPIPALVDAVADIRAGRSRPIENPETVKKPAQALSLGLLGVVLVPDVLEKTPPFIDRVIPGSPAEKAGLKPDDLVMFVGGRIVQSCKSVGEEMTFIDRDDPVKVTVLRDQELVEVSLSAP